MLEEAQARASKPRAGAILVAAAWRVEEATPRDCAVQVKHVPPYRRRPLATRDLRTTREGGPDNGEEL